MRNRFVTAWAIASPPSSLAPSGASAQNVTNAQLEKGLADPSGVAQLWR